MSKWINADERLPKNNQWIVVSWGGIFKAGQFDAKHPFGPAVVDRNAGKYWSDFHHWKPLNQPK
jgi:hypothetical protein